MNYVVMDREVGGVRLELRLVSAAPLRPAVVEAAGVLSELAEDFERWLADLPTPALP